MAITKAVKPSKLDAFTAAAPDARPVPKLRGRKRPLALTLPPDLIDEIDAAAEVAERSRAKMVELVLREGLKTMRGRAA